VVTLWLALQMQRLTVIARWCALAMSMSTVVPEIDFQPTSSRFRSDFIRTFGELKEDQAEKRGYIRIYYRNV
jgi:hypothetical protein